MINAERGKGYLAIVSTLGILLLASCGNNGQPTEQGFAVNFIVGSALEQFCQQAATKFNQQQPKLQNGKAFHLKCIPRGSGDIVNQVTDLAQQLQKGTLPADAAEFPSLISLDGDIYLSQLRYQIERLFPGQNYIPDITDAPLLANSPMVLMTSTELAPFLRQQPDIYGTLVKAKNYGDLAADAPNLPIYFVQTAPTHSNSGLQTLVAQFAYVSGKKPEQLTVADIQKYQDKVRTIQSKITRYGVSTASLAKDMVKNGTFWANIASVYESSVIEANSEPASNGTRYEAIYPKATFTSNMRAILPQAPWVSPDEKAAAEQVIAHLRSPEMQKIATELGLRPGTSGVALGAKFLPEFGVNPKETYDSLRPPKPPVIEAMLKSWQEFAKKPSQVVLLVDSSGSMEGDKLPAVQNTLRDYIEKLGPKEKIILIDFDDRVKPPLIADGTPTGRKQAMDFIINLNADGGTALYDAAITARNWLQKNLRPNAINAIIILTDGQDTDSYISLQELNKELQKSNFSSDKRLAFFTIGYGNEGEFDAEALKSIAELNGGYYRQGNSQSISRLLSDLQLEF